MLNEVNLIIINKNLRIVYVTVDLVDEKRILNKVLQEVMIDGMMI
jgi:hypothetical protein